MSVSEKLKGNNSLKSKHKIVLMRLLIERKGRKGKHLALSLDV